jgi:hypothetical protein
VSLANRMALASPLVRAICVEANEFPYLSNQFRVRGVPHTVINRRSAFVGALPEPDFVAAVLEGAGVAVEQTPHPDRPPQGGREIAHGPSTEISG